MWLVPKPRVYRSLEWKQCNDILKRLICFSITKKNQTHLLCLHLHVCPSSLLSASLTSLSLSLSFSAPPGLPKGNFNNLKKLTGSPEKNLLLHGRKCWRSGVEVTWHLLGRQELGWHASQLGDDAHAQKKWNNPVKDSQSCQSLAFTLFYWAGIFHLLLLWTAIAANKSNINL